MTAQEFFNELRKVFGHETAKEMLDELEFNDELYEEVLILIKENRLNELLNNQ